MTSFIGKRLGFGEGVLYNLIPFGQQYIYDIRIYIPILIFVLNIILITCLIIFSFRDIKTGIFTSIIFIGSIVSALSVSFSSTIYASGARIFFVTDFLILIVIQNIVNLSIVTNKKILE